MNLLVTSIAATTLLTTLSGFSGSDLTFNRPISEYCAMTSLGYELANNPAPIDEDKYSLPAPFHTESIVNYKLAHRNELPEVCKAYLASY